MNEATDKCMGCGLSFIADDIDICCNKLNGLVPGTHVDGYCKNCCPGTNHGITWYETSEEDPDPRDAQIASQAAEIARLTVALKALYDDCVEYARINNLHNADGSPATNHAMRQAAALLRPQPQPAQAETPVLSREIEFAEVTTDETGTYLAIWENGVHHSFLIEDVFEAMTSAPRTAKGEA